MKKNVDLRSLLSTAVICAAVWMGLELFVKPLLSPSVPAVSVSQTPVVAANSVSKGEKSDPRLTFENQAVQGSLTLKGACIDQWKLKRYRKSHDVQSDLVDVLAPIYESKSFYAQFPWGTKDGPTQDTLWQADQQELRVDHPVTLSWINKKNVLFELIFRLDQGYGMTVEQRTTNKGDQPLTFTPQAQLCRTAPVEIAGAMMLYEGPLGVFSGRLKELDYKKIKTAEPEWNQPLGKDQKGSGWIGMTDKYWLSALVSTQEAQGQFSLNQGEYMVTAQRASQTLAPGQTASEKWHLFVGPKNLQLLEHYEKDWSINKFDLALDFGWFYFLTKPLLVLLIWFKDLFGNFGWAILAMTVLAKLSFFPLAIRAQRSMTRMRGVQAHLQILKARYGDDKMRFNQEVMAYYRKEKVSPLSGFLPFLIQIPVFFALYKVLFVSIEMRQASFWWIHDLAEADPTSFFNGFGLFPWSVPDMMKVGLWPILMGISMAIQQALNTGKTHMERQQRLMLTYILPLVFTFMLAKFPVGLVIYWTWSNILSILQQWVIQRFWPQKMS